MSLDTNNPRDIYNEVGKYGTRVKDLLFSPDDRKLYRQLKADGYIVEVDGVATCVKPLPYSDTEAVYKATFDRVFPLIQKKLDAATKLLSEAEALSDQHGVPFHSPISALAQEYCPKNLDDVGISLSVIAEISGVSDYDLDGRYGGWQHSAVC